MHQKKKMGKLELLIIGAALMTTASGLSLPTLKFFGGNGEPQPEAAKLESSMDDVDADAGKAEAAPEKNALEHDNVFSTLHLPGLPGIPLPPMPPVPAFLQRPQVKATKTVIVEMTHYEKTHPVCWTVDPQKPPCDSHADASSDDVVIKPTATVTHIKPTVGLKNPLPVVTKKPVVKPVASEEVVEEEEEDESAKDAIPAESREGRYIQFGTPVVTAGDEVKIDEAPQDNVAAAEDEKDARIISKLIGRHNTVWETKTIYATKTEKVQDHATATLIIDNCVPVDSSIPKCKAKQPLVDTYGQNYEDHFDEIEDADGEKEKGRLTFLQKLIAQQAALAEGGAHYAAQLAAQHAAYHAALAHKFHSTAAQIAQNNANNALAAENAALESAAHHQEAEHAAHENLVKILSKYTKKGQQEAQKEQAIKEQTTTKAPAKKPEAPAKKPVTPAPVPVVQPEQEDRWRIVADSEE
ncbi:unnamed protein product [Bemisia tabaci]|uniref:Uncharacterized protein n=2 Tax=Bemisia tabaci TaxID=7038 RepID=A0A9P0G4E5_BEMTA|nr:unnamed protein product [Bemisia tabaci]